MSRNIPRGAKCVVPINGLAAPTAELNQALSAFANVLTMNGYWVEWTEPSSGRGAGLEISPSWWSDTRRQALDAIHRAEASTGVAPCVAGVGLGALVAVDLALDGQAHALLAWQPDLDFPKLLDRGWQESNQHFLIGDASLKGSYASIQPIRTAVEMLRARTLPVPALVINDLDDRRAADQRWLADQQLRHQLIKTSTGGAVARTASAGWHLADTMQASLDWLARLPARDLATHPRTDGRLAEPAAMLREGRGSVFVSYRHEPEASRRAEDIRHYLLAAGFRVFLDKHSMRPTDIRDLVHEVITRDCSGGVIVLTPDIANSTFVKEQEVPRLLAHAERHQLTLAVDNTQRRADNPALIDTTAPLSLLNLGPGTLDNFIQYDLSGPAGEHNYGIDTYISNMLATRVAPLRNMPVYIDVQTYVDLEKDGPENKAADLRIRVPLDMKASTEKRNEVVKNLQRMKLTFRELGVALHAASPERVIITGGGLFSATFALGGMLSERRLQCPVIIEDQHGTTWGLPGAPDTEEHRSSEIRPVAVEVPAPDSGRVAVLIGGPQTNTSTFEEFVKDPAREIAAAGYLTYECADDKDREPGLLKVGEGTRLAKEFVKAITTQFKEVRDVKEILLCFALGFPLSVLLGRQFNKYRVVCYDLDENHTYVPMLAISGIDAQIEWVCDENPYLGSTDDPER